MTLSTRKTPCLLERRIVPKVWGGRDLERVLGIELPGDEAVGETWEVFDRPDGASRIRDGGGRTIADLVREDAAGWLGARFRGVDRFPLLVKFIDARKALSVQLHPDDERAVDDSGKHEAWVVLDVGADGRIIRGLLPGVSTDEFAAAIPGPEVEKLLHAFRPEVGQAVMVPAGTVHAIGPDIVLFEVQQNSDLTYRVYDWGRPRELHVDQALAALRETTEDEADTIAPTPCEGGDWLIRHELFSVRRYDVDAPRSLPSEGEFKILSVIAGQGTVGWRSGGDDPPLFVRSGDTMLVPADLDEVFLSPVGQFRVLWTAPGTR